MNLFGTAGLLSLAAVFGFLAKGIRRPDRVQSNAALASVAAHPLNPKIVSALEDEPETWDGSDADAVAQTEPSVSEGWQMPTASMEETDLPPGIAPPPSRTSPWNLPPLPVDAPATDLWSVAPKPPLADVASAEIPAGPEHLVTTPTPVPSPLEASADAHDDTPPRATADDRMPPPQADAEMALRDEPDTLASRTESLGAQLLDDALPPMPVQPPPADDESMQWLTPVDALPSAAALKQQLADDPEYQAKAGWVARLSDEPLDIAARRRLATTAVMLDDPETLAILVAAYQTDTDLRPTIFAALDYYRPRNARALYAALLAGGDLSDAELAIDRLIGYGHYDDVAPAFFLHDDGIAAYAALRLAEHVDLPAYCQEHDVSVAVAQRGLEPPIAGESNSPKGLPAALRH